MRRNSPFLDTNVLVYGYVENDPRTDRATALIAQGGMVSVQVLGEFVSVARRKLRLGEVRMDAAVANLLSLFPSPLVVDLATFHDGRRIAARYGYQQFDAQIVASALAAGADELLSEDMQHGQVIDGRLTIRNPFLDD